MKWINRISLGLIFVGSFLIFFSGWIGNGQTLAHANEVTLAANGPPKTGLVRPLPGERSHVVHRPRHSRAKAYFHRGTTYYNQGRYGLAVQHLSKALALDPKSPDAYFNRGLSYRRQNKIEESISDFSQAIQLRSGRPEYYFERCNARIVKGYLEGAVADCSETIRLAPGEPEPYLLRGVASMFEGNLDGALSDSVRALQIQPNYKHARRLLYEVLVERGKRVSPSR